MLNVRTDMDSASPNLTDFFVKGYVTGEFFEDVRSYRECYFPDCNDPNIGEDIQFVDTTTDADLDRLHRLVGEKIVGQIFANYKLQGKGMWEGVDQGSCVWHNDFVDGMNMNTNILVYIDDTSTHDNSIEFKNHNEHYKVLPRENDFVWINQSTHFFHRATHNSGRRRVLSFEFYINELV